MSNRAWPEAPNAYAAVTSILPNLCGILAAFSSGYFAAVIVSDSPILKSTYSLAPFGNPSWLSISIPIQKYLGISIVCLIVLIFMFLSISQSVAALMLRFDPQNYFGEPNPPTEILDFWSAKRQIATSRALLLFHLGLPFFGLSLVLLLDGVLLTIPLYATIFWLIHTTVRAVREQKVD